MTYTYDAKTLRRAIEAAGGHAEVARIMDVSKTSVRYWWAGMTVPSASNLAKLATALGLEPGAFFRGK